jgi:hypothetical protein
VVKTYKATRNNHNRGIWMSEVAKLLDRATANISPLLQQKLPPEIDKVLVETQEILFIIKDDIEHRNKFLELLSKSFKKDKEILDALAKL